MTQPTPGSQADTILRFIERHGSITPRDALAFGCYRLAARIHELRQLGHPIVTEDEQHPGGSHARYVLNTSDVDLEAMGQGALW